MEEIRCPFCDRSDAPIVIRENGFFGRRCRECGLIFVSPRPGLNDIRNLYAHDEAQTSLATHFYGGFEKRLHARYTLRLLRRVASEPTTRRRRLLEIGPGAGYFVDEARRAGFEPHAIEMAGPLADFIENGLGIPCSQKPLSAHSFGDGRFDVIYHCDVLSHFYDPISELERMHAKLTERGVLMLETGNLGEVEERYLARIASFQYPDHLFFFGERSLGMLLDRTGFDLIHIERCALAPQMRLVQMVGTFKRLMGRRESPPSSKVNASPAPLAATLAHERDARGLRSGLKHAYELLSFWSRYRLGALLARPGRPQTVIVVARRR